MATTTAVADSSPLIALTQIGLLPLLEHLYARVLIPPAVDRETKNSVVLPTWITIRSPAQPIDPRVDQANLGLGEREAIALATEVKAEWLIVDDLRARRVAVALGRQFTGTGGLLLAFKNAGLMAEIRSSLDALELVHFYLSPELRDRLLRRPGEL